MTVQGTMTGNTSRGEHADELFHPKPAKAPLGYPVVKTGQTRPSAVRFKTGQSALGSDAPSEPPSRLVKATRRNYCESSCSNHVHWPVLKRPSVAGFQAPLDTLEAQSHPIRIAETGDPGFSAVSRTRLAPALSGRGRASLPSRHTIGLSAPVGVKAIASPPAALGDFTTQRFQVFGHEPVPALELQPRPACSRVCWSN